MIKKSSTERSRTRTQVVGAVPSGVTKKVASSLGDQIKTAFVRNGKTVEVKGMRFIPSTKVDLGQGAFQVMANTVVEVAASEHAPKRSQSIDSVVTIGHQAKIGQFLKSLKIPSLDRMEA